MRRVLLLLAITAACGGRAAPPAGPAPATTTTAAAPAALAYAAAAAHYRIESRTHTEQEVMGNAQSMDATVALLVNVVSTLEGPNLATVFTVDSANGTGMQAEGIVAVRGLTFRTSHTPTGRPLSLTTPDSANPILTQVGQLFRGFYPRLPERPPVAGFTWTDTVSDSTTPGPGMVLRTQSTRENRVVGWEDLAGTRALRVATTGRYTITGEGEQGGQALSITGTGLATVESVISAAGILLSQTSADSTNLTVTVMSMGLDVPIRQTRHATLTRLP